MAEVLHCAGCGIRLWADTAVRNLIGEAGVNGVVEPLYEWVCKRCLQAKHDAA